MESHSLLAIHDKTSCEDVMNYCDFFHGVIVILHYMAPHIPGVEMFRL